MNLMWPDPPYYSRHPWTLTLEGHLHDKWWQKGDVQCELFTLLTPELCHNLWACIGKLDIELIGPYPGPLWTMTLEVENGHKYKYGTPPSLYDGYLHYVCALSAATWKPMFLHGYPVYLHGYPVCLCMDTLCASACISCDIADF
jgi:hypothetical protein